MCTYTYNSVTDLDAVLQMDFLVAIAISLIEFVLFIWPQIYNIFNDLFPSFAAHLAYSTLKNN